MKASADNIKVAMISLGCAKNLVDAEVMLGTLLQEGVEITNDPSRADVLVVNTCSFIEAAKQESVDTILETASARDARNRGQAIVVAGCLPQRFREELPRLLPEVDAFMGVDQVTGIAEVMRRALAGRRARLIGRSVPSRSPAPRRVPAPSPVVEVTPRPRYIPDYATPRFRLTPQHFAYVKIAEGCNHPCSFCIIPRMRGSHRSRPQADLVAEAKRLLAEGVKELNLISQDSTYYGLDLGGRRGGGISSPERFGAAVKALPPTATTICTLLRELNGLPGDFWIRLLYTHPAHWTDELIQTIGQCPKVARYVDIPLQHIHPNMLERMRRETSREHILELLARIRAGIPGIALRTTFIVGFPGETEACFQSLLDFIRAARFERLGVFTYSQEQGTRAAGMAGQVPDSVRRRRRGLAMAAQQGIASEQARTSLGRSLKVLVEGQAGPKDLEKARVISWEHGFIRQPGRDGARLKGPFCVARSEADAPDIDGRVYVRGELPVGHFAQVRITGHSDYDLIAEP